MMDEKSINDYVELLLKATNDISAFKKNVTNYMYMNMNIPTILARLMMRLNFHLLKNDWKTIYLNILRVKRVYTQISIQVSFKFRTSLSSTFCTVGWGP
jgi:hypothetical protein